MKTISLLDKRTQDPDVAGRRQSSCGCGSSPRQEDTGSGSPDGAPQGPAGIVTGFIDTPAGRVSRVATRLTGADRRGEIKSRISSFRMEYTVPPGLYAVGAPDDRSDVLVSANYKLSFDALRRELGGISAWILVIDTNGINVWCAAGKGTFGTGELSKRIVLHGLDRVVSHRRVIVPQLGAPGVDATEVKRKTGFRVFYGPVRASDLPGYIAGGYRATPDMRTVKFTFMDRLVLTPIEIIPAMKSYGLIALVMLVLFGLDPSGILFRKAWAEGMPMAAMGFAAVLTGAFLTPLLLPLLPFRSFAVKGLAAGTAVTALLVHGAGMIENGDWLLTGMSYAFFPALSSYLALQFTGATTFTSIHGVKKELKYSVPLYIAAAAVSVILLILYKLKTWNIIYSS